jgi:hypothetical protein
MRIAVPHRTTREKARSVVEQRVGQMLAQFGDRADDVEHTWIGDQLRFKGRASGFHIEGTLEITDAEVIIDSKLPFLAKPFERKIRTTVEKEAEAMFRTA